MNFVKGDMQEQDPDEDAGQDAGQDADLVGTTIGALPVAPLAMPRQVLERPGRLRARLAALFGAGIRTRGLGN